MSGRPFIVRKAAVLGAGVMGAQIAAHLVNANVPALLYELPAKEGDPNGNVSKAIDNLRRLEPSRWRLHRAPTHIQPANYDQHLPLLKECDLVIEAISERMDWKSDLYRKVAPHLGEHTIFASNTSGLSINRLAEAFPAELRRRFCGVHFFNPPRYMHLVELIPARADRAGAARRSRDFPRHHARQRRRAREGHAELHREPRRCFSLLATIHHAERLGIGFDTVDALTGALIGRPKSATFRTADVVGLDTFAHVVNTMKDTLPEDPWHRYYEVPAWLKRLIAEGALGQKTRRGVYQKVGRDIQVLDAASGSYRLSEGAADERIVEILKNKNIAERFEQLHASDHPQGAVPVVHLSRCVPLLRGAPRRDRAQCARPRSRDPLGFRLGARPVRALAGGGLAAHRRLDRGGHRAGRAMAPVPLPAWATDPARTAVHTAAGSYAPAANTYQSRSELPVYRRQPFPATLVGEELRYGETIFETDGVRCWHTGDDIAIVSFKSRMHAIGGDVLEGVLRALDEAERNYMGLVIWQTEPPFSVGANLKKTQPSGAPRSKPSALGKLFRTVRREAESLALKAARQIGVADQLMAGRLAEVEQLVEQFQETTQALKFSMIPTVAAVDGLALGGGCEFIMHCDRAVATLESYIGLVEVGVGLLPAGGGCKEFAMRAAADAKGGDIGQFVQKYFKTVAMAEVGRSAEHAKELGYLRPTDTIVMNRYELLEIAKAQLRALAASGYRPPLRQNAIPVAGRNAIGTIKAFMVNMLEGGQISEHDYLIGSKVATVLCGGEVEGGSLVDEQWFLDLERRHFMELMATEKTQARIEQMLKTGKPLRN